VTTWQKVTSIVGGIVAIVAFLGYFFVTQAKFNEHERNEIAERGHMETQIAVLEAGHK